MLVDHELSGLIVGLTLATRAEDIYRALIEATAFGTRTILDAFADAGRAACDELFVAGGLIKNPVVMQIYADVTRMPLHVIGSDQGPALGSAMHAAVAAGVHPDIRAAAAAMGSVARDAYVPDERARRRLRPAVRALRAPARPLRPRRRRRHAPRCATCARGSSRVAELDAIRREVCALHAELPRNGLVAWTSGNLSARVPGEELMVDQAQRRRATTSSRPRRWSSATSTASSSRATLAPSSDAATHGYVYRHLPEVGGIAHTHSPYATAWAIARRADPVRA